MPKIKIIKEYLNVIEREIRANSESNKEAKRLQITPEITQKLIELLQEIGYENPQEVLRSFVKDHSIEFLIQTIHYLYQLSYSDNQAEMKAFVAPILSKFTDTSLLSAKLGKVIIDLFKQRFIAPQII